MARTTHGEAAHDLCSAADRLGTDEDELDPDTAVQMMEVLAGHLDERDKGFLRELVDAFPVIAEGYSGEAQEVVRNIAHGFYPEEALAAHDPDRLAELEALRDARY